MKYDPRLLFLTLVTFGFVTVIVCFVAVIVWHHTLLARLY